jgi:recombinational DNA repair ATPase RecF
MLLDDVMSELDPEHRGQLVALVGDAGQTLITATEAAHVPASVAEVRSVANGSIVPEPILRAA